MFTQQEAKFSPCQRYRYWLMREWEPQKEKLVFLMLNPSTADATKSDQTVSRCLRRAEKLGYGGLEVLNLFALRSTDPKALRRENDPIGPDNDYWIDKIARAAGRVICAWGGQAGVRGRQRGVEVAQRLYDLGVSREVLDLTKGGVPRHPLYVAYNRLPQPWVP